MPCSHVLPHYPQIGDLQITFEQLNFNCQHRKRIALKYEIQHSGSNLLKKDKIWSRFVFAASIFLNLK